MALTPAKSNIWVDRAFIGINLLIVVVISYFLVKLFFLVLSPASLQKPPSLFGQASSAPARFQPSTSAGVDPGAIPVWNLFGREGESKVPGAIKELDAPKTSLQLELQGVFVAAMEENSTAIIAERMREAKLYHVGDKLPGNATLAGVLSDRVLLNTMGRTEALYFPESSQGGLGASASRGASSFMPGSARRTAPTMGRSGLDGMNAPNFGLSGGLPAGDDFSKAIKQQIGNNPQQTLGEMGLEMNGGNGYRVGTGNAQMFAALGARPGDIIKSINGRPVGNPEADMALIDELGTAESITVDMVRDGRTFSAQVPLR